MNRYCAALTRLCGKSSGKSCGKIWLAALAALIPAIGCSDSAYFKTEADQSYTLAKNQRYYVVPIPSPTIADKNFSILLKTKMQQAGYNVVENADADYSVIFNLADNTEKRSSTMTTYENQTAKTRGWRDGKSYEETTTIATPVTETRVYDVNCRNIIVTIQSRRPNAQGLFETAWQGTIRDCGEKYDGQLGCKVETLIRFFGQAVKGDIDYDKECSEKKK